MVGTAVLFEAVETFTGTSAVADVASSKYPWRYSLRQVNT
jgi:hypothetical protein